VSYRPLASAWSAPARDGTWYDFVTSICAIVGGTFTTVGLIDAVAHKVLKAGKQL